MYTFMYTRAYMVVYVVNAYLCHGFAFDYMYVRVRVHVRTCMLQDLFPTMKQSYGTDLCSPDLHSVTVYKRYVLLLLASKLDSVAVTVCACTSTCTYTCTCKPIETIVTLAKTWALPCPQR